MTSLGRLGQTSRVVGTLLELQRREIAFRSVAQPALDVETRALRRSTMWPELRPSYALRRAALVRESAYSPPGVDQRPAPRPARAPFLALVDDIEWEPPTIPSAPGEVAEHAAQVVLVEVNG